MSNVTVTVVENNPVITTVDDVTTVSVSESVVSITDATTGPQGATGTSYTPGDPIYVTVRNATGATLSLGTIVYTSGGNGTHTQVSKALATSDATSARVLGWLAADIANNASGLCQVEGYIDGINTQGIAEGTQLYLSGTVAGSFQTTKPQAPIHLVYVGVAVKASAGNGRVYVKVQNGYELDEIHDVQIISVANNDVIKYDSATSLWKNVQPSTLSVGTATYATTSGTAVYATNSGTAVNISGTVSQSQVTSLTTDLTNRAVLNAGNAFTTGGHTITSEGTTVFPLSIIPFTGQTANTFRVRNSANNGDLMSVDSSGQVRSPAYLNPNSFNNSRIRPLDAGSIIDTGIFTNVALTVQNTNGTATANLTEWKNSGGTVVAKVGQTGDLTAGFAYVSGLRDLSATGAYINTTSTNVLLNARTATNKGLVVQGAASQSASLFEIQDSTGGTSVKINQVGNTTLYGNLTSVNNATFSPNSTATVPLNVQGAASQSANLQNWLNSAGGTATGIDFGGKLFIGASNPTGASIHVSTGNLARVGQVIQSVTSQTADQFQIRDASSGVLGGRNAVGQAFTGSTTTIKSAVGGTIQSIATGANPLVTMASIYYLSNGDLVTLAGTTGGTYDGTFVVASTISPTTFTITSALTTGQASAAGTVSVPAQKNITSRSAGTIGAVIRGAVGQNANLQEWQNSAGTVLASISSAGALSVSSGNATITSGGVVRGVQVSTNTDLATMRESNSGGFLRMTKQTAALTNPGANLAGLYFRDGTTLGTLKLVVRAGAAGAETTILDNIPQ